MGGVEGVPEPSVNGGCRSGLPVVEGRPYGGAAGVYRNERTAVGEVRTDVGNKLEYAVDMFVLFRGGSGAAGSVVLLTAQGGELDGG